MENDLKEPAMRKLIYWVHTSLDGFIDGPNGAFDWPVFAEEMQAYAHEVHGGVDTFLYGRKVWDMMSAYWPTADENTDEEHALRFAPQHRTGSDPGATLTYWAVDDVEATYKRLLSLGATTHEGITERGPGFVTASVVDPFGNVLAVMYNQHYLDIVDSVKGA